ncbi:type VI secretion system lipoprotein TssJ [Duganella sp. FT80W]|uniref:Type VI secretion system lipoprotein TssJ n=1 Tax=Duganella guangzhouensis TaxID=2666084 RepID=A0A6I2KXF0_9BURK|nr:type VI secretion system lipoprotein TssJ [Duganella guangzhouensis]MRW89094.1 type VI secretion system lipoprotein TssJ [Duganella guangzhouensis]
MKTKTIAIAAMLILPVLQSCSILRGPPELPDTQKPARSVAIRLHAGPNLNAGANKQPFALAVRIYKLRQPTAFQRMPFDAFLSMHSERELLGNDLLEVKEVMLIPNQRYEMLEKVTREAYYIGVVALFRAPSTDRWRITVPAADAEKSGITIGLHACAISTGDSLVPVHCD